MTSASHVLDRDGGHADDPAARTCTIWYIRRELGRADYGDGRLVTYVRALVASRGFPPPLPHEKRGHLVEEVTVNSRWLRSAVDAWLDDFLPPEAAASVDRAQRAAAADEMDAAAFGLRLVRGGRAS